MPAQFKYKAIAGDGASREGVITAVSSAHVEEFLTQQDLIPVAIKEIPERRPIMLFAMLKGQDYELLISFTNQLATLYRAGVPLLRALALIRIGKVRNRFNFVIDQLRMGVESGRQLSEVMADYPDIFSGVYIAGIAAGEESGKLDLVLDELSAMLEREMEIGRQLKMATRYPIVVVTVILLAAAAMMTWVIPKFMEFYGAFNADLPLPTRILIGASTFTTRYWPIVLGILVAFGFGFKKLLEHKQGRRWFDRKMVELPIFGDLVVKANVARFCLMFRILFRSGLPVIKSCEILVATVKNTAIAAEITALEELFRKGQEISLNTGQFRYFPEMALQLMSIGVESGSLERMLEECGTHYSKEVMYRSRQMTQILEPILTVVLGVFVLIMALAMFLPMWNLIKVFKG